MKIIWEEPEGTDWRDICQSQPKEGEIVDIWLQIAPSPSSMGMGDEFGVPDAWFQFGQWYHMYRGRPTLIQGDAVSHWRPRQPGAIPFGPGWGPAPSSAEQTD